jgi:hypothetical protein
MIDNMIRSYCLLAAHISVLCVMGSPVVNFTCDKRRGAAISPVSVLDVVHIQPHLPEASKKCIFASEIWKTSSRTLNRKENSDMPDWPRQRCVTMQVLPERATCCTSRLLLCIPAGHVLFVPQEETRDIDSLWGSG